MATSNNREGVEGDLPNTTDWLPVEVSYQGSGMSGYTINPGYFSKDGECIRVEVDFEVV